MLLNLIVLVFEGWHFCFFWLGQGLLYLVTSCQEYVAGMFDETFDLAKAFNIGSQQCDIQPVSASWVRTFKCLQLELQLWSNMNRCVAESYCILLHMFFKTYLFKLLEVVILTTASYAPSDNPRAMNHWLPAFVEVWWFSGLKYNQDPACRFSIGIYWIILGYIRLPWASHVALACCTCHMHARIIRQTCLAKILLSYFLIRASSCDKRAEQPHWRKPQVYLDVFMRHQIILLYHGVHFRHLETIVVSEDNVKLV